MARLIFNASSARGGGNGENRLRYDQIVVEVALYLLVVGGDVGRGVLQLVVERGGQHPCPGGGGGSERGNTSLTRERLSEDQAHGGGGRHAVLVDIKIGEVGKSRIGEQSGIEGRSERQGRRSAAADVLVPLVALVDMAQIESTRGGRKDTPPG